jgi:hypothetical protein
MRKLLSVVALLGAFVVPATAAEAAVDRYVATDCPNGNNLRAWKGIPGQVETVHRDSGVPCNGYVPDISKPWYVWNRPMTDLEAAARSVRVWWGHCNIVDSGSYWGGTTMFGGRQGWYYKWYRITC